VVVAVAMVASVPLVLPRAAHAAPELAPVMLVLDGSGSMKEATAGGGSKMAAAKRAVKTLLRHAPEGASLGLTVYGTGTGNAAADKARGCRDVKVVREVGPLDRSALTAAVDGVKPSGYTPIGESLRVAAAALPAEGPRSIVLVSDGEDTCAPPDPCDVAKELAQQGVDLRVHAIGFAVDGKARRQLSCLARTTGGNYLDAPDAASLTTALNRVTQQALRSYQPVGTPVRGTKTPDGAPELRTGTYLDEIGRDEERFYTVEVPPGHTLYATATAILAGPGQYLLHASRYNSTDGADCAGRATETKDAPAASAQLRWEAPASGTGAGRCDQPGAQVIRVFLDHATGGRDDGVHALEVLIGLEPPLAGPATPAGTADRVVFKAPAGQAESVSGGGSFSSAAALDGSGSYTDTVFSGEMVFYRFRLDWGQGLAYRLRLGRSPTSVFVRTAWHNPARNELESGSIAHSGEGKTLGGPAGSLGGPPVRYRNRELRGPGPASGVSLAGWYYISVLVDEKFGEPVDVPVTLEVSVGGETEPGPGYAGEAGRDTFGEQAPGEPRAPGDAAEEARGLWSTVADAGPLVWVGVPLLAVLLGGGLLITLLVMRRRRTPASATGPYPPQQYPPQQYPPGR
jgi:Ca-activated chloride channel family protein